MTYDSMARCVVLYQGATLTFRATWEFAAGAWNLLSVPTGKRGPLTSTYHVLAYDSTDGYALLYSVFVRNSARVATTWGFSNGTWRNLTNPSAPTSIFQYSSVMVNDPALNGVLMAGVTNSSSPPNHFWEFSNGNWTPLTLVGTPSSVAVGALAFESSTSRMIMHPNGLSFYDGDSATWALVGRNWSPVRDVTSTAPPARYDEGLASWGVDGAVLFGGCGAGGKAFSDTWYFAGGFWTNLTSQVGVPPAARCGMVMIEFSDSALKLNGILVYGGTDGPQVFSDTWLFNGTWHRITTLGRAPPARFGASMAYDNPDSRYVLFGGRNLTSFFGDTWYIRPALGGWSKAPITFGPPPQSGALMNFQVDLINSGRLHLFGGRNATGTLNDTWEFYHENWTLDNGPWLGPLPFSNVIAESSGSPHGPIIEFGGSGTPGATWFYRVRSLVPAAECQRAARPDGERDRGARLRLLPPGRAGVSRVRRPQCHGRARRHVATHSKLTSENDLLPPRGLTSSNTRRSARAQPPPRAPRRPKRRGPAAPDRHQGSPSGIS